MDPSSGSAPKQEAGGRTVNKDGWMGLQSINIRYYIRFFSSLLTSCEDKKTLERGVFGEDPSVCAVQETRTTGGRGLHTRLRPGRRSRNSAEPEHTQCASPQPTGAPPRRGPGRSVPVSHQPAACRPEFTAGARCCPRGSPRRGRPAADAATGTSC